MGLWDTRTFLEQRASVTTWPKGRVKVEMTPGSFRSRKKRRNPSSLHRTGHCKWFSVRMGFGFISMSNQEGSPLESPVDVFIHEGKIAMEGFRSLKEGEPVEFTFKKSSKGLESIWVTGPGGSPCLGSKIRPEGNTARKRKLEGCRCCNCGGLDHHAKECSLSPPPKKGHYCQSITHVVSDCPHKLPGEQVGDFGVLEQVTRGSFMEYGSK